MNLLNLLSHVPTSWIQAAGSMRGKHPWIKSSTDWLSDLLRNREGCIQKGAGRGLRFNGGNSAVGFVLGTHDLDVQYVLSRLLRPGMVVYDIGANVGFTAVIAAKGVQPGGEVLCFEPLKANADLIRNNASLNSFDFIKVYDVALGCADGEAEFAVSDSPTWGRLTRSGATPAQNHVERVMVRSLDSLDVVEHLPAPQFIKMDVEGAEAEVLAGGRQLLSRSRPTIVIELHHTYDAVAAELDRLDYCTRPIVRGDLVPPEDGEYQILAFPREHPETAAVCDELRAGRMEFQ